MVYMVLMTLIGTHAKLLQIFCFSFYVYFLKGNVISRERGGKLDWKKVAQSVLVSPRYLTKCYI